MTVTAFQVEVGNVNIADSSGTFAERRKLGISPANAVDGYHIRWSHPYTNLDSTVNAPYFRFANASGGLMVQTNSLDKDLNDTK
jgi:hypothetical protein|tara:strand:+ start:407 stop:658 length:252 start_codon:yes stop_codon:yes gene_type:complete